MADMILKVESLECQFGGLHVLNGVSFSLNSGETVGLIGPNGSGKTTVFNCLGGFVELSSGAIYYKNDRIESLSPSKRALMGISRVFQNSGIFRDLSVEENMLVAIEARLNTFRSLFPSLGRKRRSIAIAHEHLTEVGLIEKRAEKAASLSGGQLRLLEISRALAFGSELLLLDEPTAGVSPKMKEEVIKLISKLKNRGKTVLIIEHDITMIQRFCQRILVLDAGKVLLDDTPQAIRGNPKLQEIYFGAHRTEQI